MIKNIVFDIGRVLVEFEPHDYLCSFGFSEDTVQALEETVFARHWNAYDRGDYATVNDMRDALIKLYPAYKTELELVLQSDWVKIHALKQDTATYLAALKARSYRVYLLSNLSRDSYDYITALDFFHQVDGGVFSYQEHVCKPEPKLYETLLSRYGLQPEETVFLDDTAKNIAAAEKLGIHGILFTDFDSASAALETLLQKA
ncbi:MAG: HAD family phosphatase [Clostridia bacterium]|nr:HAD family phosphatase [Clostridia bacterium]